VNQFFQDKLDDVRKVMHTYDTKLANLASVEKLNAVQIGFKDIKYNIERELEFLQERIKEVQDKGGELGKRITNLEQVTFEQPTMGIQLNFNQ
jgi:predicted  nucleic acid-binding Zn-ribbon protein